jgi:CRP-like cAMP-binding protein
MTPQITFSPRQQIVSAGDPMDAIYLIAQGEVEIYKELPSQVQPAVFAEHDSSTQGLSNGHTTTAFGMQGVADVQPLVPDFIRKSLTHSSCNQPGAAHPDSILCTCAADLHLHGVPARQSQGGFMLQGAGLPHGVPQLSSIDEHVVKLGSTTGAAGDADMEMEVELPPPAEDSEASAAATIAAGPGPAKQKDDHHHVTFRTPPSVMMTGNSDTAVNGSSRQGSFSVPPLTRKSQHQHHQPLSAAASLAEPIIAGIGHPHALINGSHTEPRDDLEDVDEFLCTSSHIQQHQHGPLLHMPFSGLADAVRTSNNQETGVTSSGSFLHNSSLLGASELTGQHTQGPTSGEIAGHVLILAVKGPGDSLGLASLHPPSSSQGQGQGHPHDDDLSQGEAAEGEGLQLPPLPKPTWQAHVRARGEVLAFKADVDNMNRLLALHPELEAALKNIAGG